MKYHANYCCSSSSSLSSAIPTPTTVPWIVNPQGQNCTNVGCWSEATYSRALILGVLDDYSGMTIEMCASYCGNLGYDLFGVEYSGECYCGDQLECGSAQFDISQCNMECAGDAGEYCGGPSRLDVYQCLAAPTVPQASCSSSSSSSSSSAPTSTSS